MDTGCYILKVFFEKYEKLWLFVFEGEEIRFKVVAEDFSDTTPSGPSNETPDASSDSKENKRMSYRITVIN